MEHITLVVPPFKQISTHFLHVLEAFSTMITCWGCSYVFWLAPPGEQHSASDWSVRVARGASEQSVLWFGVWPWLYGQQHLLHHTHGSAVPVQQQQTTGFLGWSQGKLHALPRIHCWSAVSLINHFQIAHRLAVLPFKEVSLHCILPGTLHYIIHFKYLYLTLDNKTNLKSLRYICSNSQKYTAWVKIIDFSFMPKIIRTLSKDHVPWRYLVNILL